MTELTDKELNQRPPCERDGHLFTQLGDGYYKNSEDGHSRDTQTVYQTLFCQKCGETMEVVLANRKARKVGGRMR